MDRKDWYTYDLLIHRSGSANIPGIHIKIGYNGVLPLTKTDVACYIIFGRFPIPCAFDEQSADVTEVH